MQLALAWHFFRAALHFHTVPYFDYNATTPMRPEALAAWQEAQEKYWHNPSSPYRASAAARLKLDECRERLATIVGVSPEEVVFTSGATESNNTICAHLGNILAEDATIAVSAIEHPSVLEPFRRRFGERIRWLLPDKTGVVSTETVKQSISDGAKAIVLMAANNETGVIMPWQEVATLCREKGIPFICDASQWIGKMPSQSLETCDFFCGCAHKFGGPKGGGFLVSRHGPISNNQLGGSQESGQRGGTENLPAILAMVVALETAEAELASGIIGDSISMEHCASRIIELLPQVQVVGQGAPRLWNTLSLIMPYADNTRWVAKLDRLGFQVSTGSACATAKAGPSHVLSAMGISSDDSRRVIRISGGWQTTEPDWIALAQTIADVATELSADADVIIV